MSPIIAAVTRRRNRPLFVYGTLMQGEPNHLLLAACPFLGAAATAPAFELVDCGAFPALVGGGAKAVAGELYRADAATLAALDALEGHPDFYRRQPVALAGGGAAEAYLLDSAAAAGLPRIPSGDWRRR